MKQRLHTNPQRKSESTNSPTKLTPEFCKSLTAAMPSRIAVTVRAKGDENHVKLYPTDMVSRYNYQRYVILFTL
jgi:hypothetical protein